MRSKLYTLSQEQFLPVTLETAWDFFSNPANLCRITPAWLNFTLTCPAPARMYSGQILTYTVQPFPLLRSTWITEITHVREPYFFVDEQRLGPYAFWHHQHIFYDQKNGVLMQDLVNYALHFGYFGDLVHALAVRQRVKTIFSHRQKVLEQMFPGSQ